jgi:uncharacterized protein (DUF1800 family)
MKPKIDPAWAWKPYAPSEDNPWNLPKVGHLYRRAAFGATWNDLQRGLKEGPDKTIDRLLQGGDDQEQFEKFAVPLRDAAGRANNALQARAYWLYRILHGPHPLREKLTLFWHNHFATSVAKVRNVALMLQQIDLLRKHALGNFRTLLLEVSIDPAMMIWLDTNLSKKGTPNENYARELMELFCLGIGNYTEEDIREAARAFTGWTIEDGKAVFQKNQHDDGEKTVFGKRGKFQAADIVNLCFEKEAAAAFVVGKLYRFLVSETVPAAPEVLAPLAEQFRKSNYDFGAIVSTILRSNLFFSPIVYRTRVKAPVDFAMGIVRALEGRIGTTALAQALEGLGQSLLAPPSVAGWDGGEAWLNGQTLLSRQNLALAITSTEDPRFGRRADPAALARQHGMKADEELVAFFLDLFLQGDAPGETKARLVEYAKKSRNQTFPAYWSEEDKADYRVRSLCHLVLTQPEYQLD